MFCKVFDLRVYLPFTCLHICFSILYIYIALRGWTERGEVSAFMCNVVYCNWFYCWHLLYFPTICIVVVLLVLFVLYVQRYIILPCCLLGLWMPRDLRYWCNYTHGQLTETAILGNILNLLYLLYTYVLFLKWLYNANLYGATDRYNKFKYDSLFLSSILVFPMYNVHFYYITCIFCGGC